MNKEEQKESIEILESVIIILEDNPNIKDVSKFYKGRDLISDVNFVRRLIRNIGRTSKEKSIGGKGKMEIGDIETVKGKLAKFPKKTFYSVQIANTSGRLTHDLDHARIMSMLALICKKLKINPEKNVNNMKFGFKR